MKKCEKCGKPSEGNFCVFCGGSLIENDISKEKEKIVKTKKEINIFMISSIILLVIVVLCGIYIYQDYKKSEANTSKISSLENQIKTLKKEKEKLQIEKNDEQKKKIEYKTKADFMDENIVFVLDGYGKYYYTYDQVQQVTQGRRYEYWAYNKEQAIGLGYRAWK